MRHLVNASVGFLSRAGSQLCLLAVTILSTRTLGLADFGAYAIASSIVIVSRTLYFVGAYEYLLKTPEYPELKGSCLVANLLFAVISCLVSVGFAMLAPWLFGGTVIRSLVLLLTPSLCLAALTAWFEALLLRRQRVRTYYGTMLTADIVASLATAWGFHLGYGVFALLLQTYVRLIVIAICYSRFISYAHGWRLARPGDVVTIVRWSWPRYTSAFLNYWSIYGADLLLGAFLTPAASGLYRASNRIVSAASDLFGQPLQTISQTRLSARSARSTSSGHEWLMLYATVASFAWAALAGLAAFSPTIVGSLLGKRWLPAVPIVIVLCAIKAVTLINAVATSYLTCENQQGFMLRIQTMVAILIVSVSAALALFGPLAVAVGVGAVLCGGAFTLGHRAAVLSGVSAAEFVKTIATALVPALAVLATVVLARPLGSPQSVASPVFATELLLSAAGGLLGLFLIRGSLLRVAVAFRSSEVGA